MKIIYPEQRVKPDVPLEEINDTTYQADFNDVSQVEIGNLAEVDFIPEIKIKKHDAYLNVKVPTSDKNKPEKIKAKDKLKRLNWKSSSGNEAVNFYTKKPSAQFEFGSFELELVYNVKPSSDEIILNIETAGLNFYKQLPFDQQSLSPEDVGRIVTRDEFKGYDAAGKVVHEYAENMINSIAAYRVITTGTGTVKRKAFHIPRVQAIDSNGQAVWCDIDIDVNNRQLKITLPQQFYNQAAYPIIIDPEFGYTSLGAAAYSLSAGTIIGIVDSPGEYGLASELYAGLDAGWAAGEYAKMALYTSGGNLVSPQCPERQGTGTAGAHFEPFPNDGGAWISSQDYAIVFWCDSTVTIYRDTGGTNESKYYDTTYGSWPSSVSFSDSNNFYSTYASYISKGSTVYWGISATSFFTSIDNTNIRHMGGVSPNLNRMVIDGLRYYTDGVGTVTEAVYIGGDLDDPTNGATQVREIHNQPTVAGWNTYNVPEYAWAKNTNTWLGVAKSTGIDTYYQDESAEAEDFQTARGRWSQTLPADYDETIALPTTIGAGSFSDWWYGYALRFFIGHIAAADITLEETTMAASGKKVISGSINVTFEQTTISASGGGAAGSISATNPTATMAATGGIQVEGTAAVTNPAATMAAAGVKMISGSINATFDAVTMAAQGTPVKKGQAAVTNPATTMAADGIVGKSGTINQAFSPTTMAAAGYVYSKITGSLSTTMPETIAAAEGGGAQGDINTTLPATTMAATGKISIVGSINVTLSETTMQATGGGAKGSINTTLPATTMAGTGNIKEKIKGSINATFEAATMAGTGTPRFSGSLGVTLEETFCGALGIAYQKILGSMAVTLPETISSFAAYVPTITRGTINTQFEPTSMAAGTVVGVHGSIAATMPELAALIYGINYAQQFPSTVARTAIVQWLNYVYDRAKINLLVIWEDQNAPRPVDPYVSLRINAFNRIGQDYISRPRPDGFAVIGGNRDFTLSIQYHGADAIAGLEWVRTSLNWCETNQILTKGHVIAVDDLAANEMPDLDDSQWKPRAVLDVLMRAAAITYDEIGFIEKAEITGKYKDIANNLKYQNTFNVP